MWILLALGSSVTAALVAIFAKIGLRDIDPTQASIVRVVIMAIIMVLGGLAFGKLSGFSLGALGGRGWVFILLSALAGSASWLLYFTALKIGPAGSVAVIDKLSVVMVLFFAALFLGEALTIKSSLGILLTILGTLLIVLK